jgi:hypothetical protein|nr:MAG TPA: hypothetical protein [Caudoviricetes sp.]
MIRLIDNNNKATEVDYQHYTYTERLSFDARDEGGFARWDIEFTAPNRKGERMRLSVTSGHLFQHLFKRGDDALRLNVETYVYDSHGNCFGCYNPLIDYARNTVIVEKILADTETNRKRLIGEVGELFYAA